MSRIAQAAIVNPLSPDGDEILQFYSTAYRNVGVNVRKVGKKDPDPPYHPYANPTMPGPLKQDSPLVVMRLNNQIQVFGISSYIDERSGEFKVCRLSPGFDYDDISTAGGVLAGTGDGDSNGWLYEFELQDNKKVIKEHVIGESDSKLMDTLKGVHANSQLAAFFDNTKGNRYALWQTPDVSLAFRPVGSNTSKTTTLNGTQECTPGTPIAACALAGTFFIFYVSLSKLRSDNKYYLCVVQGTSSTIGDADEEPLQDAQVAVNRAYITAVPAVNTKTGKYDIYIYYLNAGDDNRSMAHFVYHTDIPASQK